VSVTLLGAAQTRQYLMIELHGGERSSTLDLPDMKPRILSTHDYPTTAAGEDTKVTKEDKAVPPIRRGVA
jgi:hypothetical protein